MLRLSVVCLTATLVASSAAAQAPVRADSTADPVEALWISLGLGGGSVANAQSPIYARGHATFSHGPFLVTGGTAGTSSGSTLDGGQSDAISSWSFMAGVRTQNPSAFLTAAAGLGIGHRTHRDRPCEACNETVAVGPTVSGFALDLGAHADFHFIGLALDVANLTAPHSVRFGVWSLSVEVGGFGW